MTKNQQTTNQTEHLKYYFKDESGTLISSNIATRRFSIRRITRIASMRHKIAISNLVGLQVTTSI